MSSKFGHIKLTAFCLSGVCQQLVHCTWGSAMHSSLYASTSASRLLADVHSGVLSDSHETAPTFRRVQFIRRCVNARAWKV